METVDHTSTIVLSVGELRKGMYVSYLDRPWLETNFPFRGFQIESDEELEQLRATCEYVFIHTERGSHPQGYQHYRAALGKSDTISQRALDGLNRWTISADTESEFSRAREAISGYRKAIVHIFTAARKGDVMDLDLLRKAAMPLRDSIERCPDAALFEVRSAQDGDYLYRHAVACGVMGLIFGRALGVPEVGLLDLAVGCALLDIGKTRIPQELLDKPSSIALTANEVYRLRKHVEHGIEYIDASCGSSRQVKDMVATHHERHNGHGYPDGLVGSDIPYAGAIAGIVDLFDAMISQRNYGRRATGNEAMRYIRQRGGKDFSQELTDQFVQVFRLYPTGSLVELSDGTVGRVIQQHESALLTPRVHLILDEKKNRIPEFCVVDLTSTVGGQDAVCIQSCMKPGSYGIDY